MGTRSNIAIKNNDGTYDFVYCHWDGYLNHNGVILWKHYRDEETIRRLVDHGDISSLRKRIDPIGPHSYDDSEEDTTVFYHRDRNEDWDDVSSRNITAEREEDLRENAFLYLWKDGEWWTCGGEERSLRKLLDALIDDEKSLPQIASFLKKEEVA